MIKLHFFHNLEKSYSKNIFLGRAYLVITICWAASLAIGSPILLDTNNIETSEPALVSPFMLSALTIYFYQQPNSVGYQ